MTNDTTTLNGALTELGELMADNLNSMGVSDADASDGLTTLANKILDIAPVSQSLTLTSDKSILSAYDSEYATLTATLSGGVVEGQTVSFDIVSEGSVVENIGTATTNSGGVATVSYYAKASGDLYIQATCNQISSSNILVEDCSYYNTAEVTRSSRNGSTIYDNNLSQALPSKCEISFDIHSNNNTDGGEHRFFLLPKTQYSSGTTQPSYGIYVDALKTKMNIGKRENGSTVGLYLSLAYSSGSYRNFKILKDGTSLTFYIDGNMIGTSAISWIGNYSDYCLSMIRWSTSGTSKLRNVKFKSL